MAVEQGSSLTIVERRNPVEDPAWEGEFVSARRIWLGSTPGIEWLHDEVERRVGPEAAGWFMVRTRRDSAHVGASGETATVILELLGAGVAGKVISDLVDYARQRARENQRERRSDEAPDFDEWEHEELVERLRDELAEILAIPRERLETSAIETNVTIAAAATYRDRETGATYRLEVGKDEARFVRARTNEA